MTNGKDRLLMKFIRQVNLDMLWSRERGTVNNLMTNYRKSVAADEELGLPSLFPQQGPWEIDDREYRTSDCPTQSLFFTRFMTGLLHRMEKEIKIDRALDVRILILILKNLEKEACETREYKVKRDSIILGFYLIIAFTCSLRGNEGFMIDLNGLIDHVYGVKRPDDKDYPHVVITLLGRFKNEWGERWHIMLAVGRTASGLEVRRWLEMFLVLMLSEGRYEGPAICEENGDVISSGRMNQLFWK